MSSLQIALGQVQNNLTDPKFHVEADDQDLHRLNGCLGSCTLVFEELRVKVVQSGLDAREDISLKRTWDQVKWSFTDNELAALYQRIEAEKSTLVIIQEALIL